MNELRCEQCGTPWYSAAGEASSRPCERCGGKLVSSRPAPRRSRRFARKAEERRPAATTGEEP